MKHFRLVMPLLVAPVFLWQLLRPHEYRDKVVDPRVDTDPNDLLNVTVDQAAELIRSDHGKKRVLFLYAGSCAASNDVFPEFVRAAREWRYSGIAVHAFSVDESDAAWRHYLGSSSVPFAKRRLARWPSGRLIAALGTLGITIADTWHVPLLAVLDENGQLLGQAEGADDVEEAKRWLASARAAAR